MHNGCTTGILWSFWDQNVFNTPVTAVVTDLWKVTTGIQCPIIYVSSSFVHCLGSQQAQNDYCNCDVFSKWTTSYRQWAKLIALCCEDKVSRRKVTIGYNAHCGSSHHVV